MKDESERLHLTPTHNFRPILILPPLILTVLERRGTFNGPNGKRLSTLTNLGQYRLYAQEIHSSTDTLFLTTFVGLIGAALLVFLPPAIATFPQRGSIDPKKLEEKFRHLDYSKVEFNKGL